MFNDKKPILPRRRRARPWGVGDRIIINGGFISTIAARVSNVVYDPTTDRTRIDLSWGEHGTSRVYAHDEGKIWTRVEAFN